MTGAMLLVGFGILKIHERDILEQKVKNGKLILKSIQDSVDLHGAGKAVVADREFLFHRLIQIYADPEEIAEIGIVDLSQRVIAGSLDGKRARPIDDADMANAIFQRRVRWKYGHENSILFNNYRDLKFFSPLFADGELLGGVYVRLSLVDVMRSINASQRLIVLLVLLDGGIMLLFGSFLLSRVVVNPLKTMVRATEGIARGDYDQRVAINEGNEIGMLADSFNEMTHRLRESQRNVQDYVRSLEVANERLQQTQMELIRSEKLASIGRFAAGVAHEVGNPLGAILGYMSIVQEGMGEGSEALDYMKRIEVEVQRINRIIRELLDFSRPSAVEIKAVDLNRVIEDCLSLLSYQKSFKNIKPVFELKEDLPVVQADESQIRQVFMNLMINAADSMPEGGQLTLKTEDYILQEASYGDNEGQRRRRDDPDDSDYTHLRRWQTGWHPLTPLRQGNRVICASIADTGCGIDPEDFGRIFDPFFTTKDPDKGTGLGLSISLRIIESFGGKLEVESQIGKGSTFRILLPLSRSEVGE